MDAIVDMKIKQLFLITGIHEHKKRAIVAHAAKLQSF